MSVEWLSFDKKKLNEDLDFKNSFRKSSLFDKSQNFEFADSKSLIG